MLFMNKKILIAAGVAVVIIGIIIVGSKAYFGDSATELPGEEKTEKALNLQEKGESKTGAINTGESNEAGESKTGTSKTSESKTGESNEAGESKTGTSKTSESKTGEDNEAEK
jgi:hypothetical protein